VRKDSPAAPEGALVSERAGYSLFVIEKGKAVRREVEIGLRRPGLVEIASGVKIGEEVVVEGQLQLNDGDQVEITNQTNSTRKAGS
jgi:membrane fusion protein (multidrug efflux system)